MKILRVILLVLSVIFFVLNFTDYNINEDTGPVVIQEKFTPSLTRLNSLSKLVAYTDSLTASKRISPATLEYAIEAKNIVSERFYHKYATQNLNENWIAAAAQKITGLYLSSKITADDILTRPYGYCGQQSAVLMELLENKNLKCRAVYFPHHFAMQSYINGRWCYFDADMEPETLPEQCYNEQWLSNRDSLAMAYKSDTVTINKNMGYPIKIRYGKINEVQGARAQLFQLVTKALSKIAFVFPLLWCVYLGRKNKVSVATNNTK
jgi:hypothetical protein